MLSERRPRSVKQGMAAPAGIRFQQTHQSSFGNDCVLRSRYGQPRSAHGNKVGSAAHKNYSTRGQRGAAQGKSFGGGFDRGENWRAFAEFLHASAGRRTYPGGQAL